MLESSTKIEQPLGGRIYHYILRHAEAQVWGKDESPLTLRGRGQDIEAIHQILEDVARHHSEINYDRKVLLKIYYGNRKRAKETAEDMEIEARRMSVADPHFSYLAILTSRERKKLGPDNTLDSLVGFYPKEEVLGRWLKIREPRADMPRTKYVVLLDLISTIREGDRISKRANAVAIAGERSLFDVVFIHITSETTVGAMLDTLDGDVAQVDHAKPYLFKLGPGGLDFEEIGKLG